MSESILELLELSSPHVLLKILRYLTVDELIAIEKSRLFKPSSKNEHQSELVQVVFESIHYFVFETSNMESMLKVLANRVNPVKILTVKSIGSRLEPFEFEYISDRKEFNEKYLDLSKFVNIVKFSNNVWRYSDLPFFYIREMNQTRKSCKLKSITISPRDKYVHALIQTESECLKPEVIKFVDMFQISQAPRSRTSILDEIRESNLTQHVKRIIMLNSFSFAESFVNLKKLIELCPNVKSVGFKYNLFTREPTTTTIKEIVDLGKITEFRLELIGEWQLILDIVPLTLIKQVKCHVNSLSDLTSLIHVEKLTVIGATHETSQAVKVLCPNLANAKIKLIMA